MSELDKLSSWYGEAIIDRMNGEVSSQPADTDPVKLKSEWQGFLPVMSERRELYQHKSMLNFYKQALKKIEKLYKMKGSSICHQNSGMIQIKIPLSKICILNTCFY